MRRLSTHALRQRWLTAALAGLLGSASVSAAEMVEERIESDQLTFSIEKVAGALKTPGRWRFYPTVAIWSANAQGGST